MMIVCDACGIEYPGTLDRCPSCHAENLAGQPASRASDNGSLARPNTRQVSVARYVLQQPQRFSQQVVAWAEQIVKRREEGDATSW